MSINQKTIKLLFMKSGGICAFPQCENPLIYPDSNDTIIAEMCHIISSKENGPRYDSSFPKDKLDEIENLILFCLNHHELVDKDIEKYNANTLRKIKKEHESLIQERLKIGKPWDCNFTNLHYINIPRVAILSAINGIEFDNSLIRIDYLHSLGLELVRITQSVINLINRIKPKTLPIEKVKLLDSGLVGLSISFSNNFRTKNMPYPYDYENGKFVITGELLKDPLIYKRYHNFKLVLTLNPRWVTTTTAFGEFTSGWARVSGICIIKQVDINKKLIIATPLILGIPRSPYEYLLNGNSDYI